MNNREFLYPLLTAIALCMIGRVISNHLEIDFAEMAVGALVFWQALQWWKE